MLNKLNIKVPDIKMLVVVPLASGPLGTPGSVTLNVFLKDKLPLIIFIIFVITESTTLFTLHDQSPL